MKGSFLFIGGRVSFPQHDDSPFQQEALHFCLAPGPRKQLNLFFFSLQVGILLYMADLIVRLMWKKALDPDNFSIPYLTALGDLLGTGFLALCFRLVWLIYGADTSLGN